MSRNVIKQVAKSYHLHKISDFVLSLLGYFTIYILISQRNKTCFIPLCLMRTPNLKCRGQVEEWTVPNDIMFMEAPRRLLMSINLTFHFSKMASCIVSRITCQSQKPVIGSCLQSLESYQILPVISSFYCQLRPRFMAP